jgi:integrase
MNYREFMQRKDLTITKITGRTSRKEQVTISPDEMELIRLELYSHDERYGLIFDISETCALRRQEVLNIKAGDITLTDGDMFIIITHGKGNKERKVFVKDDIALLILDYLKDNPMNLSDYLFESRIRKGYPMDKTNWNKAFTKACLKAVGKKFHPHQLRGTRATTWYDQGVDIAKIQQRLGHSDISTTMLYIKPDARQNLKEWSKEQ